MISRFPRKFVRLIKFCSRPISGFPRDFVRLIKFRSCPISGTTGRSHLGGGCCYYHPLLRSKSYVRRLRPPWPQPPPGCEYEWWVVAPSLSLYFSLFLSLSFSQEREREREIFFFSGHGYSFSPAHFWRHTCIILNTLYKHCVSVYYQDCSVSQSCPTTPCDYIHDQQSCCLLPFLDLSNIAHV